MYMTCYGIHVSTLVYMSVAVAFMLSLCGTSVCIHWFTFYSLTVVDIAMRNQRSCSFFGHISKAGFSPI